MYLLTIRNRKSILRTWENNKKLGRDNKKT